VIPVSAFEGREIAVFGLARSGLTAARALVAGGARPCLWDDKPRPRAAAFAEGFNVVDLRDADWRRFAALVLAPGAPLTHPAPHWTVGLAQASHVEIIGDVELFARAVSAAPAASRPRVVAVTGTNGKSTTTALIGHMLRHAGRDARIGGNIGVGVLGLDPFRAGAIFVLELSSFQLDLTHTLKPDVAIILNLTEDHLDRHGDMEGYAAAKRRVLRNLTARDTAVIGVDDPWGERFLAELQAAKATNAWPVSVRRPVSGGVYVAEGVLYDALDGSPVAVDDLRDVTALPGRHNWQNAACAYAAARALGIGATEAISGLRGFPGLAHRMETIRVIDGVRFVNDSKATNVDAARQAMSAYPRFYWIAGGRAKSGIDTLSNLFGSIAKAYLIGEAAADFGATLAGRAPVAQCGDMDVAVRAAFEDARATGEEAIVLFSPACASFDQFADFEARGEAFRSAVLALQPDSTRGDAR